MITNFLGVCKDLNMEPYIILPVNDKNICLGLDKGRRDTL